VWAEELSTAALLKSIRQGHVVVMADATTPPPVLTVRAGGQAAHVGDELAVAEGDALEIEVGLEGARYAGGRLDLVWRGEVVAQATLGGVGPVRFTRWATSDGYLRVHAYAASGAPLALTNPVFVRLRAR
jgi:hypothetical protein